MALQPTSARSPPGSPPPQAANEKPFSLTPAIFTPYSLPSNTPIPPPNATHERLELILSNLAVQHDTVRRNMLYLIEQRSQALVADAKVEIAKLRNEYGESSEEGGQVVQEAEGERMMRCVRTPMREGVKGEELEIRAGMFDARPPSAENGTRSGNAADGEGDVQMGNASFPHPRTAMQVRRQLKVSLQELVERGAREIEAYDAHAQQTTRVYKDHLDRGIRSGRFKEREKGKERAGILKKGTEEGVRRRSTGKPMVDMVHVESPARVFENLNELARRGSK